jgi:hypothetical protein
MLAQFQARYPTGSLISELLTIYQGKFVVRVSVQVEGVTRATGMAAAETPELAEDRARERALVVLAIDAVIAAPANPQRQENNNPPVSIPPEATATQLFGDTTPQQAIRINAAAAPESISQTNHRAFATTSGLNDPTQLSVLQASPLEKSAPESVISPEVKGNDAYGKEWDQRNPIASTPTEEPDVAFEDFELTSDLPSGSGNNPPISFSNVTPLVQRSYSPQESTKAPPGKKLAETKMVAVSEPIDLSDAIARTSVELKRLGWSNQQGREYLEQKYNKRSRQHLNDEEMLEFLHYLESLPSP